MHLMLLPPTPNRNGSDSHWFGTGSSLAPQRRFSRSLRSLSLLHFISAPKAKGLWASQRIFGRLSGQRRRRPGQESGLERKTPRHQKRERGRVERLAASTPSEPLRRQVSQERYLVIRLAVCKVFKILETKTWSGGETYSINSILSVVKFFRNVTLWWDLRYAWEVRFQLHQSVCIIICFNGALPCEEMGRAQWVR